MFHAIKGLGQAVSAGTAESLVTGSTVLTDAQTNAANAQCQWCLDNQFLAWFTPACWGSVCQSSVPSNLTQAYTQGAASTMPPSQAQIDSQTPDQTINQILADSQTAAVNAATVAAGQESTDSTGGSFTSAWDTYFPPGGSPTAMGWMIIAGAVGGGLLL